MSNRLVPIKWPWSEILASLERRDNQFLFYPDTPRRCSKNFIDYFASALARDPDSTRFQMARARPRFVCDRWNEGIQLTESLR